MRVPVCPIWSVCGRHPLLVTTREQPTAPPSRPASSSSCPKPSAPPTPRPPPTTTLASESDTLPAPTSTRSVIRTARSCSESEGMNDESSAVPLGPSPGGRRAGGGEFGLRERPPAPPRPGGGPGIARLGGHDLDAVGHERRVEQRGGVGHHLRAPVARRRDGGARFK